MQHASPGRLQSAINVTPLVDVVLVLLIIFMVIAPQMQTGPDVQLPVTERPERHLDTEGRILVAVDERGRVWVEDREVSGGHMASSLREAAETREQAHVVIQGDARLSFGDVRRVMLAVESAGFPDVSLVAERRESATEN